MVSIDEIWQEEGMHDILFAGITLIKFNRMISERSPASYFISSSATIAGLILEAVG